MTDESLKNSQSVDLDRGVFTLSLDFELIWGTLDLFGPERFRKSVELERRVIIDRLLDLFVEFNIPATWCVLGHLFLDRCEALNSQKHPHIVRPSHAWHSGDWFKHDLDGVEGDDSIFLGRSLIEKIRSCPVRQEIGCHSFSHVIFGDPGCSREAARSDIAECLRLAREMGIRLRSFAFPRNRVGHLDVLRQFGFVCFRGPEPYEQMPWPGVVKRLAHFWQVVAAVEPPVFLPEKVDGLWNIPGSMIYFPAHGLRRHIPVTLRVRRAIKGLDAAQRQKKIFHLWFHPTNLADEMDRMFAGLRRILQHACDLRQREEIKIAPMGLLVTAETCARAVVV